MQNSPFRSLLVGAMAVAFTALATLPISADADTVAPNTTGLPTYPRLSDATMDNVPRDFFGHRCTHYESSSPDDLATVLAWYRKQLGGVKEAPVNADNWYGHFKLDGIKFTKGTDIVNVYRTQDQKDTSIELFKCTS